MASDARPVWSTEHGQLCPACGQAIARCACPKGGSPGLPADGIVRVSRQTKGRGGKGVTLVTGLPLDREAINRLCKDLKKRCGCGGAVKDGVIEIQGEQRDTLVAELEKRGFKVKRVGG